MRRSLLAVVVLAVLAVPAMAQETGTSAYLGPDILFRKSAYGVTLSDPGSGIAVEGTYRVTHRANTDLGFRVGFADPDGAGSTALLLGVNYRARLLNHTEDFPLDGALVVGAGTALANGNNVLFVPVGISLGRQVLLENSTTSFVPYFAPTIIPTFSDNSDLNFAIGLGVDMRFGSRFDLGVSGSIGDLDGVSISFSWLH
jgi:hypothetical protein